MILCTAVNISIIKRAGILSREKSVTQVSPTPLFSLANSEASVFNASVFNVAKNLSLDKQLSVMLECFLNTCEMDSIDYFSPTISLTNGAQNHKLCCQN